MPVEGLLPEPVVAAVVTILIQILEEMLSSAELKFTVTGVLLKVGPVLKTAGNVAAVVATEGLSPMP